jgi:hypothetical protein
MKCPLPLVRCEPILKTTCGSFQAEPGSEPDYDGGAAVANCTSGQACGFNQPTGNLAVVGSTSIAETAGFGERGQGKPYPEDDAEQRREIVRRSGSSSLGKAQEQ